MVFLTGTITIFLWNQQKPPTKGDLCGLATASSWLGSLDFLPYPKEGDFHGSRRRLEPSHDSHHSRRYYGLFANHFASSSAKFHHKMTAETRGGVVFPLANNHLKATIMFLMHHVSVWTEQRLEAA